MAASHDPKPHDEPFHPAPGLEEPGPEGEWPFPSGHPGPDTSSASGQSGPRPDPAPQASEEMGLVDPRAEGSGPALLG